MGSKDTKPRKIRQDYIDRICARKESRALRKLKDSEEEQSDEETISDESLNFCEDDGSKRRSIETFKAELFSQILTEINRRILTQSFHTTLSGLSLDRNC